MASFLDEYNNLDDEQEGVVDAPDTVSTATASSEEEIRAARKRAMGSLPKPSSDLSDLVQPSNDRLKNRQQLLELLGLEEDDIPDPHGAIAETIGWTKGAAKSGILGYAQGQLNMEKGRIGFKMKNGTASPDDVARLNEIDLNLNGVSKELKRDPHITEHAGNVAPWIVNSMVQGGKGQLIGMMVGGTLGALAGNAIPGAQVLPEEAITAPVGAKIGGYLARNFMATKDIGEVEAGLAFIELTEMGMDRDKAGVTSDFIGAGSGSLEVLGLHFLTKLVPSRAKAQALKNTVGRAAAKVIGDNAVTRNVAKATKNVAGEATVEAAQELNSNIAQTAATMWESEGDAKDMSPKDLEEFTERLTNGLWDTWWSTFKGVGLLGAPGAAYGTVRDSAGNSKAKQVGDGEFITVPDSDENLSGVGEARKPATDVRDVADKRPTVRDLMGVNEEKTDEDGVTLSDNLMVSPAKQEQQAQTDDALKSTLNKIKFDTKLKRDRVDVDNNITKMQTLSGLYDDAVIAEDVEEALSLAEGYAQVVQETNGKLDGMLNVKGQLLAEDGAVLNPEEVKNIEIFQQEKAQQSHAMVSAAVKTAKSQEALEAMDLAEALEDPIKLKDTLVKQERQVKATNPSLAKTNRQITDMLEIRKFTSRETYLSKHVKIDKLVNIKEDLERQLVDQKEDKESSTTDQVVTQSSLQHVESLIGEKMEFDETVAEQARVDALRRENEQSAKRLTSSDPKRKAAQEVKTAKSEKKQALKRQAKTAGVGTKHEKVLKQKAAERKVAAVTAQKKAVAAGDKTKAKRGQPVKTKDLKEDKTSEYTILTSDNPASTKVSPAQNVKARAALKKKLDEMGVDYEVGSSKFEGVSEVPFVIRGLTQAQAKELSDSLGQTSFIHAKGAKIALVEGKKAKVLKRSELRLAPDATDFFTQIGGEKFTLPFYTDKATDVLTEEALSPQLDTKQVAKAKAAYVAAAVKFKGKTYTGKTHLSIIQENPALEEALISMPVYEINAQMERGFVTQTGEFHDRYQAGDTVGIKRGSDQYVHSEDFLLQKSQAKKPSSKRTSEQKKKYVLQSLLTESPMRDKIQTLLDNNKTPVELLTKEEAAKKKWSEVNRNIFNSARGTFDPNTGTIELNVEVLDKYTPEQIQETLGHEALHAIVRKKIQKQNPVAYRTGMRRIHNWWEQASILADPAALQKAAPAVQGFFNNVMIDAENSVNAAQSALEDGTGSVKELDFALSKYEEALTYPFTNPAVARFLDTIQAPATMKSNKIKTMWDWFVNHLLGVTATKGSALADLKNIADSILNFEEVTGARFSKEDVSFDFGENVSHSMVTSWTNELDASASNGIPSTVVRTTAEATDLVGFDVDKNVASMWIPARTESTKVYGKGKNPKVVKTDKPAQVIIISENITDQEHLVSKWLHEQVGHQGLRNTFPNNALLTRFLDQSYALFLAKDADTLNEVIELYDIGKMDERGNRKLTKVDKRLAAEEVIARRSEKLSPQVKEGLVKRFMTFVKKWLPKAFVGTRSTFKLADKDVMNILEMSKANVMVSDTLAGQTLKKALDARAPTNKFKGWETLPDFMFSDKVYMKWIEEVEAASPDIRKWYDKHQDTLHDTFGKDAELFNILLSVTSPQADVNTNVIFAAQTYAYMMGLTNKPGALFANKLKKRIDQEWTTPESMFRDLESKNFKVTEFVRGLNGDVDATVGDLWMFRAFFGDGAVYNKEAESYSTPQIVAMRQKLHDIAAKMSTKTGETYTAREVQAAIWVHINAKTNGIEFDQVADYQTGFNKPSARFDGLSPLEWLQKLVPNLKDGPLSEKIGITEIPMAPISPLAKQRLLQVKNELAAQGKKVDQFIVDADGLINVSFKNVDEGTLNIIKAIEQGGRSVVVPENAADWYRETFGFREVSTDKGQTTMKLSDEAVNIYTNPKGKITETQIRQNLGGFDGTYTQVARFSREARKNLDKIAKLSSEDKNRMDIEAMKSGTVNDKLTVVGKIHEWRSQAATNIDRFIAALEQEFLETFGGRKPLSLIFGTGRQGYRVNTGDTILLRKAMNMYIDSGSQTEKVSNFIKGLEAKGVTKLTVREMEQLKILRRMDNMTEEEIAWAENNIRPYYADFLEFAREHDIIDSEVANYVKRTWKLPKELEGSTVTWNGSGTTGFKLTPTSGKPRTLDSIIDGWELGMDLKTEDVLANLQTYANELGYVFANRRFVDYMRNLIAFDDQGVMIEFSQALKDKPKPGPEWHRVQASGFAKPFHELYAKKDIADILNKMGKTADWDLWERDTVKIIRRINASIKGTLFAVSVFHHFAGFRSFRYGVTGGTFFDRFRPFKAYRKGLEMLKTQAELEGKNVQEYRKHIGPVVDYLIRKGGLTIGRVQDWDEVATQESMIENFLSTKTGRVAKANAALWERMRNAKRGFTNGLFGRLFAGLKANAAASEFTHKIKKFEKKNKRAATEAELDLMAQQTGTLINADFGGLNLERMGRNPNLQRAAQMIMLAPDWTESNWRTVTGMFKMPGKNGGSLNDWINRRLGDNPEVQGMTEVYRQFWFTIARRAVMDMVVLQGLIMALASDEEQDDYWDFMKEQMSSYSKIAEAKWAKLDITPIVGRTKDGKRRSFSVVGHFTDIIKAMVPWKLAAHKTSPLVGLMESFATMTDWKGTSFTTLPALIDGGALVVDNRFEKAPGGFSKMLQIPSWGLYNLRKAMPIFVNEAMQAYQGESSVLAAAARGVGVDVRDVRHVGSAQLEFEELATEVADLERDLKQARLLKDPVMIKKARKAIKEYKGYNRLKARIGSTKAQISIQNNKIKRIKAKQKEDIDLTPREEETLQEVTDRKRAIYEKAMEILSR